MKKSTIILFIIVLIISLSSCNTGSSHDDVIHEATNQKVPESEVLDTYNIEKYLSIEGYYSYPTTRGVYLFSDLTISIIPKVPGAFYDTKIEIEIVPLKNWHLKSDLISKNIVTTVVVPPSGTNEKIIQLQASVEGVDSIYSYNMPAVPDDGQAAQIKIKSVKGTFQPQ